MLLKPQTAPFKPQVGERLRGSGETRGTRRQLQGHTGKGYRGEGRRRGLRRSFKKAKGGGGEEDYLPQCNGTMGLHQPQGRRERREAGPAHGGGGTHVNTQSKYSLLTFFSPTPFSLTFFPFSSFKHSTRPPEAASDAERHQDRMNREGR